MIFYAIVAFLVPAALYGVVLYYSVRLARAGVPGAWPFTVGCVVGFLSELVASLAFMAAVLPNFVDALAIAVPSYVRTAAFLLAVYGFVQMARFALARAEEASGAA